MNIFNAYLPLCVLRKDPLDLPKSTAFLQHNLWFYFLVWLFVQANMIDPTEALLEVIFEIFITFCLVWVILRLNKTPHLFVQIITALLFCENIIASFLIPIVMWLTVSESIISYCLFVALALWDFILITFIIKKVLVLNLAASLTLSFFYFLITYGGAYSLTLLLF